MKLSQYAKQVGVSYKTAYRWYRAGSLDAYQTDTGIIIVRDQADEKPVTGRIGRCHVCCRAAQKNQTSDLCRPGGFLLAQVTETAAQRSGE